MPPVSRNLREKLEHQLGPEATDELLNLMPPDWTQLATKHDLEVLRVEFQGLRSEVRGDIAALGGDLAAQRGELLATLHQELRKQTFFYVGALMTLAGVVLGTQLLS